MDYDVYLSHLNETDRIETKKLVEAALRGEGSYHTELEVLRADGSKRCLLEIGHVEFDQKQKPIRMYGTSQDITNRKSTEINLEQHKTLLNGVLENLPLAVFGKDIKNEFRWNIWNKEAESLFGIKAEEGLGKKDIDFFPKNKPIFSVKKISKQVSQRT